MSKTKSHAIYVDVNGTDVKIRTDEDIEAIPVSVVEDIIKGTVEKCTKEYEKHFEEFKNKNVDKHIDKLLDEVLAEHSLKSEFWLRFYQVTTIIASCIAIALAFWR